MEVCSGWLPHRCDKEAGIVWPDESRCDLGVVVCRLDDFLKQCTTRGSRWLFVSNAATCNPDCNTEDVLTVFKSRRLGLVY